MSSPDPQERGAATGDRLEAIKQGLKKHRRQDDFGGFFLTAEGEQGWPGSHIDWLLVQLAERVALLAEVTKERDRLREEINAAAVRLDALNEGMAATRDLVIGTRDLVLAANQELRTALDQAHRPHHAVDAHTEGTQGTSE